VTKTTFEIDIHRVTSNELGFPTAEDLRTVSMATRSKVNCDAAIKHIIKKLQSPTKKWRKLLKTLNLIEVMCQCGARRLFLELQTHSYLVRNLQTTTLVENGVDVGAQSVLISPKAGYSDWDYPSPDPRASEDWCV
jgi:hypothetical protein